MLAALLVALTPLPPEGRPRPLPAAPPPRPLYQWVNRDSGECGWYPRQVWIDGYLWSQTRAGDIEEE